MQTSMRDQVVWCRSVATSVPSRYLLDRLRRAYESLFPLACVYRASVLVSVRSDLGLYHRTAAALLLVVGKPAKTICQNCELNAPVRWSFFGSTRLVLVPRAARKAAFRLSATQIEREKASVDVRQVSIGSECLSTVRAQQGISQE